MAIDPEAFKAAMRRYATGVTVVTTAWQDKHYGLTVNSFCSVSLEPPLVLICIDNNSACHEPLRRAGAFAVNLLSASQEPIARRFSIQGANMRSRFAKLKLQEGKLGVPLIPGTLGALECEIRHDYPGGDHSIFVAEVISTRLATPAMPLLFSDSAYHQPAPPQD